MPRPSADTRLPRLIAIDVDGTLLGVGFTVSRRSKKVLRRLVAAGSTIVLVTGRSPRKLQRVIVELEAQYHNICANGAIIRSASGKPPRFLGMLQPSDVRMVCRSVRKRMPEVMFAAEIDNGQLIHHPEWPVHGEDQAAAAPGMIEELVASPVAKLQARVLGRDSEALFKDIVDCVGHLVEATCPGRDGLVEIAQRGVSKASALAVLTRELGIPATDTLAFGDMPNDISMLQWAGRSVAVANAHPDVQSVADDVTLSNLDDGVAAYLERLLE